MKLGIVILNWNGKELLKTFLPSVVEHSQEATVYVADNASTDGSVEFVKAEFPSVQLIVNTENGGYAQGYNDALKQVDADIFCLLNNDVEVTEGWLSPILQEFENNPQTAIVQPKLLDYKQKDRFEYAGAGGGFIDKYGYPYCRGRIFSALETDTGQYDDSMDIFWASGACFFIKKAVFEALDGFDASFFAHMEEIDLCWRAFNRGYHIRYVGGSTVYHLGGGTLKSNSPKKTFLNFRNSLLTLTKNTQGKLFSLIFNRLVLDGLAGVKFLFSLQPLHTLSVVKAHFSYYRRLKKALQFRRSNKQKPNYYQTISIVKQYYLKGQRVFKKT